MILPVFPVSDVDATLNYYVNTLGFADILRMPGPEGKLINGRVKWHDAEFMFNFNPAMADKQGGGVYFWIRMDGDGQDIDAHYAELKMKGVTIIDPIQNHYWGDRSFTIKDLNGYVLVYTRAVNVQKPQSFDAHNR